METEERTCETAGVMPLVPQRETVGQTVAWSPLGWRPPLVLHPAPPHIPVTTQGPSVKGRYSVDFSGAPGVSSKFTSRRQEPESPQRGGLLPLMPHLGI